VRDLEAEEERQAIADYLAQGGTVSVLPAYERTDPDQITHVWSKKKKGKPNEAS
jgi:hypothetical protein